MCVIVILHSLLRKLASSVSQYVRSIFSMKLTILQPHHSDSRYDFFNFKVKVAQLCPTLCDPMNWGFSKPEYWRG